MGSLQHPSHSSYTTTTTVDNEKANQANKGPSVVTDDDDIIEGVPPDQRSQYFFMLLSLSLPVQIHPLFPFSFSIFIYFQLIYNIEPTPSRADFGLLP